MKCNKCGTPIIPGESICRICGNTTFSEREKEIEIIDFPEETIENNNSMVLPDLNNVINLGEPINIENNNQNVNTVNVEIPVENLEQGIQQNLEPLNQDVQEKVTDNLEDTEKNKVTSKKTKKISKKEEKVKNEAPKASIGVILLTLLLIASLIGNVYLFVMNGNVKAEKKENNEQKDIVYSKVSSNGYNITIPATWITEDIDEILVIHDDTENWAASIQVIEKASYDDILENKDKLIESLGAEKYQFTSNYSKEVNNKDYYLFKGKYYEYSVYVIISQIDDEKILVTDLKFKGEVDDILLNNILIANGTIKANNNKELFKDNFEFKNLSSSFVPTDEKGE